MLSLPDITLIALTGKDVPGHEAAISRSCESVEWGAVKLVIDYKLDSIDAWNKAVIYDLHKYVSTAYCMLIHADGYVIRPDLWDSSWLDYDFIGAPWPLPTDDYSYRDSAGDIVRVGNSVSLRSKKILELPTLLDLDWQSYYGNTNEDGYLCCHKRNLLEKWGCRFAPLDVAKYFSKEHVIPENEGLDTFAFHSL